MIIAQPFHDAANQGSIIVRALSSITSDQADIIARAVQAGAPAWSVQTTYDYDGYLSILIEPCVSDDEQKTFFISGTTQHLELFEAHNDNLVSLAKFDDVEVIAARLLGLI